MSGIITRAAEQRLREFMASFRVVIVNGPRQAGKTTLLRRHHDARGGEFRTLDDDEVLNAALVDPVAFATEAARPLCIDEVQRGGDPLVRAVKMTVDETWDPGQFLLSGSTRFLTVPTLSESLAGRAGFIELWPLSMAERTGSAANFVDLAFGKLETIRGTESSWTRHELLDAVVDGGYPEALRLPGSAARLNWYNSYIETVIWRDVREFSRIQQAPALADLLALIAARAGSTLVHSDLARGLGNLSPDTVRNYLSYLEMVFLVGYARSWSTNLTSKVSKGSKAYITDSGLTSYLLGITTDALRRPGHPALGGLVETFVFGELRKAASLASTPASLYHLRDRDGREVDFVLETRDGRVVAIEVKASSSPARDSFRHLEWLRDKLGDRFVAGIVLHLGSHTLSHGDRLLAMPMSALWGHKRLG